MEVRASEEKCQIQAVSRRCVERLTNVEISRYHGRRGALYLSVRLPVLDTAFHCGSVRTWSMMFAPLSTMKPRAIISQSGFIGTMVHIQLIPKVNPESSYKDGVILDVVWVDGRIWQLVARLGRALAQRLARLLAHPSTAVIARVSGSANFFSQPHPMEDTPNAEAWSELQHVLRLRHDSYSAYASRPNVRLPNKPKCYHSGEDPPERCPTAARFESLDWFEGLGHFKSEPSSFF